MTTVSPGRKIALGGAERRRIQIKNPAKDGIILLPAQGQAMKCQQESWYSLFTVRCSLFAVSCQLIAEFRILLYKSSLMSYTIEFENNGKGTFLIWEGEVYGKDTLEANALIYERDPEALMQYTLWDFTRVTHFDLKPHEIRQVAFQDMRQRDRYPIMKIAIVSSDKFHEIVSKNFIIYSEVWGGFETEMFSTVEEAREWISQITDSR